MTCTDKLKELNPSWDDEDVEYHIHEYCPAETYVAPDAIFCTKTFDCKKCWEREAPDENENLYRFEGRLTGESMRRLIWLRDRLDKDPEDVIQAALLLYEDALKAIDVDSNRWVDLHIVGEA